MRPADSWSLTLLAILEEAAAQPLAAGRAELVLLPPDDEQPWWRFELLPKNARASRFILHVGSEDGQDDFEVGSAGWFELWEEREPRLSRLAEIVRAVIDGRLSEQTVLVQDKLVEVAVTFQFPGRPTTYKRSGFGSSLRLRDLFRTSLRRREEYSFEPY